MIAAVEVACTKPLYAQSSGCRITTANATLSAVQNALNAAASGSTVCVPSGSASWSGVLAFPSNKNVTLEGAGIDATVINCGSSNCLALNNSGTERLTGFTFNW